MSLAGSVQPAGPVPLGLLSLLGGGLVGRVCVDLTLFFSRAWGKLGLNQSAVPAGLWQVLAASTWPPGLTRRLTVAHHWDGILAKQ